MANLDFLSDLKKKYAHQPVFLQAVEEMALSLLPLFEDKEKGNFYTKAFLMMAEPERIYAFRVPWEDDNGNLQYNRGWRVEFSSVLGPYKGGLRLHPTVDEGLLKFLGFEQVFKNALTGLPMGGGKGGSDFNPKGKSDNEVRRFCESFMTQLFRYIGPETDVPAGDINVGGREIGNLYGTYKRLTNTHGVGVLTGKSMLTSGSNIRPEATGYGLIYITKIAIEKQFNGRKLDGMRCAVSGSGNVSQYATEKLMQLGAKVITMSDSNGVMVFENGVTKDDFDKVMKCKNVDRARLSSLEGKVSGKYMANKAPWDLDMKFDLALPCATQNEINGDHAKTLVKNGVLAVGEGANLPSTMEAQKVFRDNKVVYLPGKAANAGGVGVSGLEMSQNAQKLQWTREEVDAKLETMMAGIYDQMSSFEGATLEEGANRAGFIKVATAMQELGWLW